MSDLNGYQLSREWFSFSFDNPEKIKPAHSAIYFFAIEHCNRLGWKDKFGFPTQMAMEAVGIKNWRTYNSAFTDLVDWGFFELVEKSKNQYSSCIICLCKKYNSTVVSRTKSLDKALQKHSQKQRNSTVVINKPYNHITKEPYNQGTSHPNGGDTYPDACTFLSAAECVAKKLLSAICVWDQTHKYNKKELPDKQWILEIERAMRLDGRTKEQLEFIIEYIFTQSTDVAVFWAPNIQSGKKLRSKFDKIKNQIKQEHNYEQNSKVQSVVDSMY